MAYVQHAVGAAGGGTTDTATLTGVIAGNTIAVYGFDGNSLSAGPSSVVDGQGSYTAQGTAVATGDFVAGRIFTLQNANAGTHAIVATATVAFLVAVEMSAPTSGAIGTNAAAQSNPGTATDALSSGSVAVSASATLGAFAVDTAVVDVTKCPAAGTGFAALGNAANSVIGSWRLSAKTVAANAPALATAVTGTDNFITLGAAILNSGVVANAPQLPLLQVG